MASLKCSWAFQILLLILLFLSHFPCSTVDAYNANFPSANAPMYWKNDRFAEGWSFSDGTWLRPILCVYNKSMSHRAFGLGFLTKSYSSPYYLVVYMLQVSSSNDTVPDDEFQYDDLSSPIIVWSANRDKPVSENATLDFTAQGELLLKDVDGTPVWSTINATNTNSGSDRHNNYSANAIRMEITVGGNLMLLNDRNSVVWQSFDQPTDTWLPNQRIHFGKSLTARISRSDLSSGIYYLSVTRQGLTAFFQDSSSTPPKEYATLSLDVYGDYLVDEVGNRIQRFETYLYFNFTSTPSDFDYIVMEPSGNLVIYRARRDQRELGFSFQGYFDDCQIPTVCGRYGVCNLKYYPQLCTCPYQKGQLNYFERFEPNNNIGCEPVTPLFCQEDHSSSKYHAFVDLPNVTYFDFQPTLRNTSPEKCREQCFNNCSCKAAFFRHRKNENFGNCSLQSGELYSLVEMSDYSEDFLNGHRAFIKVQDKHSDHRKKHASSLVPLVLVPSLFGGLVFVIFVAGRCYGFRMLENKNHDTGEEGANEVTEALTKFSFEELKMYTQNFTIKLGQGGFGSVFEGVLYDGNKIAVKRLDFAGQGKKEFLSEVNTIGKVDHFNLVKLIGYCAEKSNRLLVYEHMCNGSLDKWIFNNDRATTLTWEIRRRIIRGIAKGLEYLHEECNKKIIHFDIKPQNILLDTNFNPKISDFGLAKLIDRNQSLVLTRLNGTPGYLAPELFRGSNVSVKADIYSFGVVILETMCGRRNLDSSKSVPLVHILKTEVEENQLYDVLDQRNENFLCYQEEAVKMIKIGIRCLQTYDRRPSMSMVVKALEGSNMEMITDLHFLTMTHSDNLMQGMNQHISAAPEPSILSGPR